MNYAEAQDIQIEAGPIGVDVDSGNHWVDVATVVGLVMFVAVVYVLVRRATK